MSKEEIKDILEVILYAIVVFIGIPFAMATGIFFFHFFIKLYGVR